MATGWPLVDPARRGRPGRRSPRRGGRGPCSRRRRSRSGRPSGAVRPASSSASPCGAATAAERRASRPRRRRAGLAGPGPAGDQAEQDRMVGQGCGVESGMGRSPDPGRKTVDLHARLVPTRSTRDWHRSYPRCGTPSQTEVHISARSLRSFSPRMRRPDFRHRRAPTTPTWREDGFPEYVYQVVPDKSFTIGPKRHAPRNRRPTTHAVTRRRRSVIRDGLNSIGVEVAQEGVGGRESRFREEGRQPRVRQFFRAGRPEVWSQQGRWTRGGGSEPDMKPAPVRQQTAETPTPQCRRTDAAGMDRPPRQRPGDPRGQRAAGQRPAPVRRPDDLRPGLLARPRWNSCRRCTTTSSRAGGCSRPGARCSKCSRPRLREARPGPRARRTRRTGAK